MNIESRPRRAGKGRKAVVMLARQKWQIRTIEVLELVFKERERQMELHGDSMRAMPDGTGPDAEWLVPLSNVPAHAIQEDFRTDYDTRRAEPGEQFGQLTRMHLVREELAEALELHADDPDFVKEILEVAALCVQWAELKLDEQEVLS